MKLAVSLGFVFAVLPLHAEEIRVTYSGTVSSLTYADCTMFSNRNCSTWAFAPISSSDFIPGQFVAVNQSFSGSFIYNTSMTPVISDDGYQATYLNSLSMATFAAPRDSLKNAESSAH